MNRISREELKEKLDRRDDFRLVMTLGDLAFQGKHIPGSLNLFTPEALQKNLGPDEDIVVYCSNEACPASVMAYKFLEGKGYKNVRRFSGGLLDWEDGGYPLEGDLVTED